MDFFDDAGLPGQTAGPRARARAFADDHIRPVANEYDQTGAFPDDILEAACKANLVGTELPERFGGEEMPLPARLAIVEELFRADAGIGLTLQLATMGATILATHGDEDVASRYLSGLPTGDQISGLAVTEPQSGSDLAGMTTQATRLDDGWEINGTKTWVGNAAAADWVTVFANTDPKKPTKEAFSLFVVPTEREGYHAELLGQKMGMRASQQGRIAFDNVHVPADHCIGNPGEGFRLLTTFFNTARTLVAGHGLGIAGRALEETWEYTATRKGFGRTLQDNQSVQHTLAAKRTDFEAARTLAYRAAKKVQTDSQAPEWASMAKTQATKTARDITTSCLELHGGIGVLEATPINRCYRDSMLPCIYEGPNAIQRSIIHKHTR